MPRTLTCAILRKRLYCWRRETPWSAWNGHNLEIFQSLRPDRLALGHPVACRTISTLVAFEAHVKGHDA